MKGERDELSKRGVRRTDATVRPHYISACTMANENNFHTSKYIEDRIHRSSFQNTKNKNKSKAQKATTRKQRSFG